MKGTKIAIKPDSYIQTLIAAIILIAAGLIMAISPTLLKTAFLIISIIILEVAVIKITIYFAIRPYEKRIKQFYGGIGYWIAGFICLALYFIKPEFIFVFIGVLLAAEGALGIFNALKNKKLSTVRGGVLGIGAGVVLAGIMAVICAAVFKEKMIVSGIIVICGGVLMLVEAFLFSKAESISKAAAKAAEKVEDNMVSMDSDQH